MKKTSDRISHDTVTLSKEETLPLRFQFPIIIVDFEFKKNIQKESFLSVGDELS
jgi:hypothetical protein